MHDKLNKKLAKWAGFLQVSDVAIPYHYTPDGHVITRSSSMPTFAESLDDCYKWLVPKLPYVVLENCQAGYIVFVSPNMRDKYNSTNKSPSLAICSAIEKLIDGGY